MLIPRDDYLLMKKIADYGSDLQSEIFHFPFAEDHTEVVFLMYYATLDSRYHFWVLIDSENQGSSGNRFNRKIDFSFGINRIDN